MDSNKRSSVTPSKSRLLARSIAKVLHIRAVTEISSDDGIKKIKSKKTKKKHHESTMHSSAKDVDDHNKAIEEAFIAKLFASVSSIKAAYAELQYAQSPYDPEAIQSADQMVVSELKNLSELKQSYLKDQLEEKSPKRTLLLTEIQQQSSLLKTYEITAKKLDSQIKLKDSEIMFLKEKLAEANGDVKSLEKRLNSSGQLMIPNDIHLSGLRLTHFITFLRHTVKSIRSFVRVMINEMESANWDLDTAANAIQPGILFWKSSHAGFTFESFVCREMFNGFNHPLFSRKAAESFTTKDKQRELFFNRFMEMKSLRPSDQLTWKPKSKFASFCRAKYLKLVHPDMEASLFDNLNQRNLVKAGDFPETGFFTMFAEMAKHVWLLHCLAFCFNPEVSIFEVAKGTRYSEVYMESLSDEAFASPSSNPRVAFCVFPGFRIGKTVIPCQVYLC